MGIMNWLRKKFRQASPPIKSPDKKESRTAIVWKGIGGVKWPSQDYENFAEETYMKNVIAYRAITLIANSFSSVEWKLMKQKMDGDKDEVFNTPYNRLLNRPNPDDSYNFVLYKLMCWFLIAGNSYMERVKPSNGPNAKIPKELHILESPKMNISVDDNTGSINGYVYKVGAREVFFERDIITGESDILHLKNFHPMDRLYGFAVTQAAARELDTNNQAVEWNMRLIQNECRPGMLLMFKGMLTDEQYDRLEESLARDYAGGVNAGQSLILESDEGVIDAKPYSWNPKEMDWIEGNRETARKIAYAYGVPPMMLGIPGDNTYSNYQEARLALWEDTIIPYLNWYMKEKNNWLFGFTNTDTQSLMFEYSVDDIPALIPRREMLWERAQKSDFLTINEKREMVGYDAIDGGDEILVSATMIPLDAAGEMPEEEEETTEPLEDEDKNNNGKGLPKGHVPSIDNDMAILSEDEVDALLAKISEENIVR